MGFITSHLKTFGRKTDDKNEWVCPQTALDNALSLLQPRINQEGVEIIINDMSTLKVMANDVRLEQVFINLLTNALDAMHKSPHKRLSIYFNNDPLGDLKQLTIYVTDTGSGIDSDHLHHLFDPFFSTKDVGVGLGLGLTISYSIIKTMGGELTAKNYADGATFGIQLQAQH
jgi:two-component system C4-dicarboxylate transport sensor histidine kinase DctB